MRGNHLAHRHQKAWHTGSDQALKVASVDGIASLSTTACSTDMKTGDDAGFNDWQDHVKNIVDVTSLIPAFKGTAPGGNDCRFGTSCPSQRSKS